MDNPKKLILSALMLLTAGTLVGCGGGGADVRATTVSKGQELQDLKNAVDSGAISQDEYERLRSEVIRRRD